MLNQYYFNISKTKKENEIKASQAYTFRPKINQKSARIFKETGGITENFFKTKKNSIDKYQDEVHHFHKQMHEDVDFEN